VGALLDAFEKGGSSFYKSPVFDAQNLRGYPDWNMKVHHPGEWGCLNDGCRGVAQFMRWQNSSELSSGEYLLGCNFAIAMSITSFRTLRDKRVLDFWSKYPKGVRSHDGACSKLLSRAKSCANVNCRFLPYRFDFVAH
jgi:hypothetical protein